MKNIRLLCLTAVWGCAAVAAQNVTRIVADVKGVAKDDTLTLQWGASNKSASPHIMQRGAVGDSAFAIPLNEPRLLVLALKNSDARYEILAAPGENISVTGRIRKIETSLRTDIQFRKMSVTGASYQGQYESVMGAYRKHLDSIDNKVYSEYKDVHKLIEHAKDNNEEQAIADMYQTLHGQSYIERVMSTFAERADYTKAVIRSHKDSFLGPLLMLKLTGRLDRSYKPLYDEMSAEAKDSYYGREVKDEVDPPSLVGEYAPTVVVRDTAGNDKILSFASTGKKYILIDFWASWCQPCYKEIPGLKRLFSKYHAKGLDIVGISVDQYEDDWADCLLEVEEPWHNYLDANRQATNEYQVRYIPSIFIVDGATGKIVAEKMRGSDLGEYVETLFEDK